MGSTFEAIWEDPEGGFIKFTVRRALKQDQKLHMEWKFHVILYFREECTPILSFREPEIVNIFFCTFSVQNYPLLRTLQSLLQTIQRVELQLKKFMKQTLTPPEST